MENSQSKDLHLKSDGKILILKVSEEDYNTAQNDINFANSLLFHATSCSTPQNDNDNESTNENTSESRKKSNWSYDEVNCLINSIESHMDELNHPKKKKHVFDNVANDLLSYNYEVTGQECQIKWKSRIRSYKISKDNKTKTGRGPSRFQFFDKMDDLLGNKPSNSCVHSLESTPNIQEDEIEVEPEEGSIDTSSPVEPAPKRRKKCETGNLAALLELKNLEYKKKETRHKEKLEIEEKKVAILEKFLEKLG